MAGELAAQALVVRDIAVVHHGDAERVVDIERLGVFGRARANGRIAHVADAIHAGKPGQVLLVEDPRDSTVALFEMDGYIRCQDAGRVLSPMLESQKAGDQFGADFVPGEKSDYATHGVSLRLGGLKSKSGLDAPAVKVRCVLACRRGEL